VLLARRGSEDRWKGMTREHLFVCRRGWRIVPVTGYLCEYVAFRSEGVLQGCQASPSILRRSCCLRAVAVMAWPLVHSLSTILALISVVTREPLQVHLILYALTIRWLLEIGGGIRGSRTTEASCHPINH
jgi:hypothetical protein